MKLPFINRDRDPVLVVVTEDRWYCFGAVTPRSAYLYKYLNDMGGINETVPPGLYDFNVRRRSLLTIAVSLEPHIE